MDSKEIRTQIEKLRDASERIVEMALRKNMTKMAELHQVKLDAWNEILASPWKINTFQFGEQRSEFLAALTVEKTGFDIEDPNISLEDAKWLEELKDSLDQLRWHN